MPGMYMGPSSAFGGAFGGGPSPVQARGNFPGNVPPNTPAYNGPPVRTLPVTGTAPQQPSNVLGPQAVRATGDSKGYDSSYLQNLATAIGGLFSNQKQGGNVMNVNPLGELGEISPASGMEGNAPQQGLPQTWLQQALAGLGFSFGPQPSTSTSSPTSVVPNVPTIGPGSRGNIPNYPLNQ